MPQGAEVCFDMSMLCHIILLTSSNELPSVSLLSYVQTHVFSVREVFDLPKFNMALENI